MTLFICYTFWEIHLLHFFCIVVREKQLVDNVMDSDVSILCCSLFNRTEVHTKCRPVWQCLREMS